jgi:hypothetical protein
VDIDRRWTQINADEINHICVHQRLSAVKTCVAAQAALGSFVSIRGLIE